MDLESDNAPTTAHVRPSGRTFSTALVANPQSTEEIRVAAC